MCEAGRIRHHLKHNLWKKECTILFVGYQAVGTLGRSLCEGTKRVKLFDEEIAVEADIRQLPGISGHADRDGLVKWLQGFREKPKQVFINHGDDDSCIAFTELLAKEYGYQALFGALLDALRRLKKLVENSQGRPNRDVKKLTGQIEKLCEEWED